MLDQHLAGRTDHGNRLWLLVNAEFWYRVHIEAVPAGTLAAELAEVLGTAGAAAAGSGHRVAASVA